MRKFSKKIEKTFDNKGKNMIRINVVCIGKIKEKYIKEGINEFLKRLSKYIKLEIIELD